MALFQPLHRVVGTALLSLLLGWVLLVLPIPACWATVISTVDLERWAYGLTLRFLGVVLIVRPAFRPARPVAMVQPVSQRLTPLPSANCQESHGRFLLRRNIDILPKLVRKSIRISNFFAAFLSWGVSLIATRGVLPKHPL